LTPAATRQAGNEFGRDHPLHLSVCFDPTIEEREELLGSVTPIHVEGKYTAVLPQTLLVRPNSCRLL